MYPGRFNICTGHEIGRGYYPGGGSGGVVDVPLFEVHPASCVFTPPCPEHALAQSAAVTVVLSTHMAVAFALPPPFCVLPPPPPPHPQINALIQINSRAHKNQWLRTLFNGYFLL